MKKFIHFLHNILKKAKYCFFAIILYIYFMLSILYILILKVTTSLYALSSLLISISFILKIFSSILKLSSISIFITLLIGFANFNHHSQYITTDSHKQDHIAFNSNDLFTLNINPFTNNLESKNILLKVKKAENKELNKILNIDDILNDPNNEISKLFDIPPHFKDTVKFWFNIYTKYDSDFQIIHHSLYPWILYEVVNNKRIYSQKGLNGYQKASLVRKKMRKKIKNIKIILRTLAKRKTYNNLNRKEQRIFDLFKQIPGKRSTNFLVAANNLRYQTGQKNFFTKGLHNSKKYLPFMEDIFKQYKLPIELTRIPFVESSFNLKAVSKVDATGIWQIMPRVGKQLLKINHLVDERKSPLKSTVAAAKLLRLNYKILKSWPLAITAYNHGVGNMQKAIKRNQTNDFYFILDNYTSRSFRFASKNFYACVLAAIYAEKYQNEIFGKDFDTHDPLDVEFFSLKKTTPLHNFINSVGLSKKEFIQLNPDLKNKKIKVLPKGYSFVVPSSL